MSNIPKGFPEGYDYTPGTIDVEQLKSFYLFGIDLSGPEGDPFPEEMLQMFLDAAVSQTESVLDITIKPKTLEETYDYYASDYGNWGFLRLYKCPVKEVLKLSLSYGSNGYYDIPLDWVRLSKKTGEINLFPSSGSAGGLIIGSSGMLLGMNRFYNYVPHSWQVKYTAGMDTVPADLLNYIYMLASISVMTVWGDLIIGAGIASQSIGLDGLSQSISTTQSAMFGGASGRCEQYRKDMEILLPALRKKYIGIPLIVV